MEQRSHGPFVLAVAQYPPNGVLAASMKIRVVLAFNPNDVSWAMRDLPFDADPKSRREDRTDMAGNKSSVVVLDLDRSIAKLTSNSEIITAVDLGFASSFADYVIDAMKRRNQLMDGMSERRIKSLGPNPKPDLTIDRVDGAPFISYYSVKEDALHVLMRHGPDLVNEATVRIDTWDRAQKLAAEEEASGQVWTPARTIAPRTAPQPVKVQ